MDIQTFNTVMLIGSAVMGVCIHRSGVLLKKLRAQNTLVNGAQVMKFTLVLHTDDGQRYGVTVPDLPGCFSGGEDLDDALANAQEAIDLHVEGMIQGGMPLPERSPIAQLQANPEYANGLWVVVDVPVGST